MHAHIKMLNKMYYDNNSMVNNINFITETANKVCYICIRKH